MKRLQALGRPAAEAWDQVAFVFQSPRLAPWRAALRNVTLSLELRFKDMPRARRDLLRLLEHLGATRAHLVGLSMGGRTLMGFYPSASQA